MKPIVDIAWFLAEDALRENGRGSCGHVDAERGRILSLDFCQCCRRYREMATYALCVLGLRYLTGARK